MEAEIDEDIGDQIPLDIEDARRALQRLMDRDQDVSDRQNRAMVMRPCMRLLGDKVGYQWRIHLLHVRQGLWMMMLGIK